MKYLSICSGIEAATVAWHSFGWEPVGFAEIEPFPSAVLNHHYPTVPNLGDMTKFKEWQVDAFDILVGGTPCQAFSVAGLRQSLDDARGNLSLVFCEMADHFDPPYILWENVPGVLNTKDNAFGCFLAGLAGEDVPLVAPGGKWSNAGFVLGPKRNVAWRVLDAQFFGLAQRRRRVFVVACPRDGADPREVLFEREGVQRHSAPSREKGEGASATLESRSRGGGFPGTDGACGGHIVPVCGGGPENGQIAGTVSRKWSKGSDGPAGDECYNMVAFAQAGHFGGMVKADISDPIRAKGADCVNGSEAICVTGQQLYSIMPQNSGKDYKARAVEVAQPIMAGGPVGGNQGGDVVCVTGPITHALKAEGHDGSEDGTGRGRPVIAFTLHGADKTVSTATETDLAGSIRTKPPGSIENSSTTVALSFAQNQLGEVRTGEVANTLNTNFNASGRNTPCVAFHQNQRAEVTLNDTAGSLKVGGGKPGQGYPAVAIGWSEELTASKELAGTLQYGGQGGRHDGVMTPAMQVRRLTPVECERLQGFPDGYTAIPWRNKPAEDCPDGPRYKALGNSMAVPCMRWIGWRIGKTQAG